MTDILETMKAELDESVEVLRRHYPHDDERQLLDRAIYWRPWRYERGRWLTDQDIIDAKAKAAAEAKAKADAERAAAEKAEAEADAAA